MVFRHPLVTEKAMFLLENTNQLSFIVRKEATKASIKVSMERYFGKKVTSVRTMMIAGGAKKAIITFNEKNAAEEILSQLGIV
ncbi:MAG TPA: 50S ribosomal protein L23 [Methanocorpusculum sp.]|nr:50S ribosomal protein L23 [Methanocorpusculum sp.]HJJ89709.1 50S ribosomal protein L23 [Methanocorpusculum sp.]HJJ90253.1 50S ribosomal protein L23 [Methanocorpusculum sp.]HJJ92373.1 50S ribosomal protein L23 [Methanocorpusculum sp.]HJK01879.1 50S ribosomal protein L23 [Methanocorpusculum sp.]